MALVPVVSLAVVVPLNLAHSLPARAAGFDAATAESQLVYDINVDREQNHGLGAPEHQSHDDADCKDRDISVCPGRSSMGVPRT